MVGLGASYASMDNKDLSEYMESQIFNAQLAVSYIRPLSKRWSLLAGAGVGLFMNTGSLAYARFGPCHVMGWGMAAAIWHLRDNLDLGWGGCA